MINFSNLALQMRSSEIRRLMKIAADPSIISFAGGMPNNDLFPIEVVERLYNKLPKEKKQEAFQYGPTPGYPPLIATMKNWLGSKNFPTKPNELLITTGGQQALSLVSKILVNPGDIVITEYPTFIGALGSFRSDGGHVIGIPLDETGIDVDKLEACLKQYGSAVKIVYLCPYFHNPAGIIYSQEKKDKIVALALQYNFILLEDDPYSELYFDPSVKPLVQSMKSQAAPEAPICYVGTLAKILGPGMRIGFLYATRELIDKAELAKQGQDACTCTYTQVLANEYISQNELGLYLDYVRPIYKRRCGIMLDALERYMPTEGVSWTKALGGFYIWVTLQETIRSTELFQKSFTKGAAFVNGSAFDPDSIRDNCFRLAFSHTPEHRIDEGIRIIADSLKEMM